MSGIVNFALSLLVMLLIAAATLRHSRKLMNFAFSTLVLSSFVGWYEYIFPAGIQPLFFFGTFALVMAICCFFYAVYTFEFIPHEDFE
ncbi:hypothetical protein ACO0KY_16345 [Undibacterium sp. Dicai25W]|uniref:hypothetical protein n=1 Tax=Undibacterium sp. Dicai25W TaxID=3413034 RepID=UPI003BF0FA01